MIVELHVDYLTFVMNDPLQLGDAVRARGYFGKRFSDDVLLHHHYGAGFVYNYPRVQFKVINGHLIVVGIEEGQDVLDRMKCITLVDLHRKSVSVADVHLVSQVVQVGPSAELLPYRFVTPWLGLNQNNVAKYRRACWEDRRRLLEKTIVGNILSMCKGLGIVVERQLAVSIGWLQERQVLLKGTLMTGFIGCFSANFLLPALFGLGKAVSRGCGTVVTDPKSGAPWSSL
ncbi:MAG: CRISPR-associated endonuclease Cas6 [Thermodesulfobacteriota bacterium]